MNITDKGSIYAMDIMFAFMLGTIIVFLIISVFFNGINSATENIKLFELKKNSFFIADSIISKRNTENPMLGSAEFNGLKHRVEENKIDSKLFDSIDSNEFREIKLVEIEFSEGRKKTVVEKELNGTCFGAERFVLFEGRKGKLRIVLCNE